MAIRKNTFLIKRSNVSGKIPNPGDLQLGELAINTSDVILYASGTTSNSILPIGWDRVSKTGDTMTGTLYVPTISATTYLNLPSSTFTGGTVSGATQFINGLTANTFSATSINKVDYIIFNTGTTSATTVAGTVYFDNTEKALSYNTSINQGVTVNLGQQNYIRVFNNSGTAIQKGKALELLTAFSGLPAVTLAINRKNGSNIIGISSEIIPNGVEGIAITNGIISDIQLTGMSVGSLIYASDTTPGNLVDATQYFNFPLTARTNQIGYVVQTGVTTGKLFVNINNENTVLSLTDLQRNVLEGNVISTGVFEFTGITQYSSTTINISNVKGWIVKNTYGNAISPDVIYVEYSGGTNISLPNITTADSTFILINSASTIVQQTTFPTPQQRRENIYLGKVVHPNRLTITSVNNTVDFDVSPISALRDLWTPLKLINQGILVSANGANLNINTSAGTLWGNGIGWITNQLNPDSLSISGTSPTTFQYRVQTGGTFSNTTTIDVANYDLNGVVTAVGGGSNASTNQRVYLFPTGLVRIQYGQTVYGTLAAAVAGVQTESFVEYGNNRDNGILIGVISVNKNATLLNNTAQAIFTLVSKFGEILGGTGGLSTTTLQQAYDNSTTPEIVINATLDGLSIKNGTGNADNVTRLFEGITATNGVTSFIMADGYISGTTFESNGFRANSTGITASTVNIRTIGSGTAITNLGIDSLGNVVSGTTGGSTFTGGTVTGPTFFTNGLTANTISATTYYNLPIDVYSTGGTYNGSNLYITNNTGGTFTITGLTATGFSANYYGSFSDTTNQPVTGVSTPTVWKYNTTELSNGISVVNGSQIKVANKGVYEIGYSAQIEKTGIGTSTDVTIWASINGTPVTRSSSTLSFANNNSYQLPFVSYIFELNTNDYVEFYFSSPSTNVQITSLSGLTSPTRPDAPSVIILAKQVGLSVTDNLGGNYLPLSGGTVTGGTSFNSGLTANTISATTYQNLPTDIRVTGATYSNNTFTYTNNTGGTFNVLFNTVTGLTVNGNLTVTGNTSLQGLTGTTISATTYQNLPTDIRVTGATYSNNTFTYTNNTGGTFNVLFNTVTGLTVNGNLNVTGGTQSIFSGNSSVELVRITQTGSGDAFVVEDSANVDSSHFVINASGDTAIGLTQPIGGAKLTVSGNTNIFGVLSATTYQNLPNNGLRVIPMATANTTLATASNDYYMNVRCPFNLVTNKVTCLFSTTGSDQVRVGIYRGQDLTATLVGQGAIAGGAVNTISEFTITAVTGQTLSFSGGEWMVIAMAIGGTTTSPQSSTTIANNALSWNNTTDSASSGFPTNPRSKAGTNTSFPSFEIYP